LNDCKNQTEAKTVPFVIIDPQVYSWLEDIGVHHLDSTSSQDPLAFEFAAVEDRLRETPVVFDRG
jgi:predicted Zn-dependent protease